MHHEKIPEEILWLRPVQLSLLICVNSQCIWFSWEKLPASHVGYSVCQLSLSLPLSLENKIGNRFKLRSESKERISQSDKHSTPIPPQLNWRERERERRPGSGTCHRILGGVRFHYIVVLSSFNDCIDANFLVHHIRIPTKINQTKASGYQCNKRELITCSTHPQNYWTAHALMLPKFSISLFFFFSSWLISISCVLCLLWDGHYLD